MAAHRGRGDILSVVVLRDPDVCIGVTVAGSYSQERRDARRRSLDSRVHIHISEMDTSLRNSLDPWKFQEGGLV